MVHKNQSKSFIWVPMMLLSLAFILYMGWILHLRKMGIY